MTEMPTSAFACSLIGGIITLISSLLSINSWFFMYSNAGTTFTYTLWYFIGSTDFTAAEALVLFVIGVACGILIIFGAVLQHSGQKSKVKNGSIIVLIASIVGVPSTYFGMLIGGILSITGAYIGLTWKPQERVAPATLNQHGSVFPQ
jgi:hypothetical protein